MREAVKRIVLRMFPELSGGYHLDKYARIIKISDPPKDGVTCDRFRPYWAADIQILTPELKPAKGVPPFEAVPLPLPAAGPNEGFFLWPRPGTIVTVRWIEGRPDHPVIQHIYPMGLSMPDVPDNMGRWQQRPGVHQFVDPTGNWERKTDKNITDIAQDIQETATGSRTETVGADSTTTVSGSKTTTVGDVFRLTAPKVVIGAPDSGPSLLPLISNALGAIYNALGILAEHTHPGVGAPPSQEADIQSNADTVGSTNSSLGTLQE